MSTGTRSKPSHDATVLVVDDEPDMLASLSGVLRIALPQVFVKTAQNGPRALNVLEGGPVSLVFADFKMPGMSGFDLVREMHARGYQAPVVILTAFADSGLEASARQLPLIAGFFKKPVNPDKLIEFARGFFAAAVGGAT